MQKQLSEVDPGETIVLDGVVFEILPDSEVQYPDSIYWSDSDVHAKPTKITAAFPHDDQTRELYRRKIDEDQTVNLRRRRDDTVLVVSN